MSFYRKNESGEFNKTAGNLVQRFNDRIFLTDHSVEGNADYYDIELAAKKYIQRFTDYTEYQLYIGTPNTTDTVYIRYQGKTFQVTRSDNDPLAIGVLHRRINLYTLTTDDNKIWMDPLLQPTPDTYKGIFTYALNTWDPLLIPDPELEQTGVALDTNMTYEYDGTEWQLVGPIDDPATGSVVEPLNGWYWMIEYFPNYNFGNGKIVWNGGTHQWDIYTARVPRPDETTIKTDPLTNKFGIHSIPSELLNAEAISFDDTTVSQELLDLQSTKQDKNLNFYNIEVLSSTWEADTTYPEYGYRAAVTLAGVLETDIPDVVYSPSQSLSEIHGVVADAYEGGVYIYARELPGTMTIPTIIAKRGI
jgi:hypothetical protein